MNDTHLGFCFFLKHQYKAFLLFFLNIIHGLNKVINTVTILLEGKKSMVLLFVF